LDSGRGRNFLPDPRHPLLRLAEERDASVIWRKKIFSRKEMREDISFTSHPPPGKAGIVDGN